MFTIRHLLPGVGYNGELDVSRPEKNHGIRCRTNDSRLGFEDGAVSDGKSASAAGGGNIGDTHREIDQELRRHTVSQR